MEKPKITIAVTGLNATDNPGPGVPVIRSLKESQKFECKIIGLSYEYLEPGIYMYGLIDKCYSLPYPSEGSTALINRIKEINNTEKINVIIPCFDAELYSFIKIEEELEKENIYTFLPTYKQLEDRQKYNLPHFCLKNGINVPQTEIYDNYPNFCEGKIQYPIVIKGKYYDAKICVTKAEAGNKTMELSAKWGWPVIGQELLTGTEYNVVGCGDGEGNTLAEVTMRKQYITDKGKAWSGITVCNKEMKQLCENFVQKTKWRGGFEMELMLTKSNSIYLIEINPRLPAWVYLATAAGENIPEQIVLLAQKKSTEEYTTYQTGKMFIRYSWDMIIDQKDYAQYSINKKR